MADQRSTQQVRAHPATICLCTLCHEMVQSINAEYHVKFEGINRPEVTRIQLRATDALQVAAEAYMHEFFTSRSKCVTDAVTDK